MFLKLSTVFCLKGRWGEDRLGKGTIHFIDQMCTFSIRKTFYFWLRYFNFTCLPRRLLPALNLFHLRKFLNGERTLQNQSNVTVEQALSTDTFNYDTKRLGIFCSTVASFKHLFNFFFFLKQRSHFETQAGLSLVAIFLLQPSPSALGL